MNYEIIENMDGETVIFRTGEDGTVSMFFADPANPDYQQYLLWLEEQA